MSLAAQPDQHPTLHRLPARLDLSEAAPLKAWILASSGSIVFDASGVEVLHTPVLQILMAARDYLRADGRGVTIIDPSDAFLDCVRLLGTDLDRLTHVPTSEDA